MNTSKLYNICDGFYKKATLRSDLASRTLALINDKQDLPSLRFALSGAKNLLLHLTTLITNELKYYNNRNPQFRSKLKPLEFKINESNYSQYVDFFNKSKDLFLDSLGWDPSYGGKPWAIIAEAGADIAKSYFVAKSSIDSPDEVKNIRRALMYMTVLDQLNHNTGSIYPKLTFIEAVYNHPDDSEEYVDYHAADLEAQKIIALRDKIHDSKDFMSDIKLLEKNLEIKLPFKNQLLNYKQNPDYFAPEKSANPLDNFSPKDKETLFILSNYNEIQNIKFQHIKDLINISNTSVIPNKLISIILNNPFISKISNKIGLNLVQVTEFNSFLNLLNNFPNALNEDSFDCLFSNREIQSLISSSPLLKNKLNSYYISLVESHEYNTIFQDSPHLLDFISQKNKEYAEKLYSR